MTVKDTYFYAEWDEDAGAFCVFGNNSGHAYASYAGLGEAIAEANKLNGVEPLNVTPSKPWNHSNF